MACEENGGGWSTLDGTILRTNLFDDTGVAAQFDFALWEAGNFDAVTNVWVHAVLNVAASSAQLSIDGTAVSDRDLGFPRHFRDHDEIPRDCDNNAACDDRTGNAIASQLEGPGFSGFTLKTSMFVGGSNDLDTDTHFVGKIAGLAIADHAMAEAEVSCLFNVFDTVLPGVPECGGMLAQLMLNGNFELELSFLDGRTVDESGKARQIAAFGGDVYVSDAGAVFDGREDFLAVENFDYASDGDFTVSLWVAREEACSPLSSGALQSLFSHAQTAQGAIDDHRVSNVNLQYSCGGRGVSTASGPIVRFNLVDGADDPANPQDAGNRATFDFPLLLAEDYDRVTERWVHVLMTVSRSTIKVYVNGATLPDPSLGFPSQKHCADLDIYPPCSTLLEENGCDDSIDEVNGWHRPEPGLTGQTLSDYCLSSCENCDAAVQAEAVSNSAYPYPSRLGTWAAVDVGDVNGHRWARWRNRDAGLFTSFDLRTELFVGAPTSREPRGFFAGAMAELKVYSSPMAASEARCIFQEGDQTLPGAPLP